MERISLVLKLLAILILLTACVAPAWSQTAPPPYGVTLPPPAPPGVAPAWAPVPTAPKVFYAQNIPSDLFLLQKRYYYYYGGAWYQSKHLMGPWRPVQKLPKPFLKVDRSFFKTPPPW